MIQELFEKYNIAINNKQLSDFESFLKIFEEKNAQINLSAIRESGEIVEKHFIDSLEITKHKFIETGISILDIGTGGGFPGIPLAIMYPETNFTLLDARRKKVECIQEFARELGLKNVSGTWGRAEELGEKEEFHGQFNLIVSRATAYLPTIIEWSLPFMKDAGKMIFYKLPSEEELQDGKKVCQKLGLKITSTLPYQLTDQERQLIVISKSPSARGKNLA